MQEGEGQILASSTSSNTTTDLPQSSKFLAQFGTGDEFITKVADLVTKRIHQNVVPKPGHFRPSDPNWRFYETAQPTVVSEEVQPNTNPPNNFANPLFQNDLNDSYDETHLLKTVPKPSRKNAASLLKAFDERANELTWDSSGNVYINEESLPNCNIFKIFPFLFRKRHPKQLTGISEIVSKIKDMGLSHLIKCQVKTITVSTLTPKATKNSLDTENWWYLG